MSDRMVDVRLRDPVDSWREMGCLQVDLSPAALPTGAAGGLHAFDGLQLLMSALRGDAEAAALLRPEPLGLALAGRFRIEAEAAGVITEDTVDARRAARVAAELERMTLRAQGAAGAFRAMGEFSRDVTRMQALAEVAEALASQWRLAADPDIAPEARVSLLRGERVHEPAPSFEPAA